MRSIEAGVLVTALAAGAVIGASSAHAEETLPGAPKDEIISVDINLLGCSLGAGLGVDLLLALTAGNGSSTTIGSGLATRLRAAGCLPWQR
ncbi:hypothetical protein [Nocardia arthritidis]|uniref:hypothetical protein n=1 Tax=Nocardia arthritidis TaxID=228602 RepID=UPI0007A4B7D2|nr:hypothetical protein [Nocardia arthritidis]